MFREDFEFHDDAAPSHLGHRTAAPVQEVARRSRSPRAVVRAVVWAADAERELRKIPFFVRGKARRNTERFASERGLHAITLETLYDAKAHFSR